MRVLAATHRDLEALVREGRFREDLAPLIEHFLRAFAENNGKAVRGLTRDADARARIARNQRARSPLQAQEVRAVVSGGAGARPA